MATADVDETNALDVTEDYKGKPISQRGAAPAEHPQRIGRYRIEKVLGQGAFGLVYLAHDEQLNRPVAVKVPHASLISQPEDTEAYLAEARTVANLDHPGIVPVHDVGSTDNCPCYVVSKFIDGTDLSKTLKQQRVDCRAAALLVANVAEALHCAHTHGLVHRDVKPANILIDASGKPFLSDFGLALKEEDFGSGARVAGTPSYMSPEQALGEGHRVDGRSDIFSLGVVLYELLSGRRPFIAKAHDKVEALVELLDLIATVEPRPPRQIDDTIPKELERICLKAMSKRSTDRFTTARDMADELREFLKSAPETASAMTPAVSIVSDPSSTQEAVSFPSTLKESDTDRIPIKILMRVLLGFFAGLLIITADYMWAGPWLSSRNWTFLHSPKTLVWICLVAGQVAFWAAIIGPVWRWRSRLRLDYGVRLNRDIPLKATAAAFFFVLPVFFLTLIVPDSNLAHHQLKMVIVSTLASAVALVAMAGIWHVRAALVKTFTEKGTGGRPVSSLQAGIQTIIDLRAYLQRFITVLGAIIALTVLANGALRQAILATGGAAAHFPPEYGLLEGGYFTGLLALVYIPLYTLLASVGSDLIDSAYPITAFDLDWAKFSGWDANRKSLEKRMQIGSGAVEHLRAGVSILAPVAASVASLLLGTT